MQQFELNAEKRVDQGKGASRRLRHAGKVPAILYGAAKEPLALQVQHNELNKQLEHEAFYSHVLTLKVDGKAEKAVLKDIQRHPSRPLILHLDFQRVDEKEELTMRVPVHFMNEEKCVGVKQGGGVISHLLTDLEVTCLPKDLPEYISVDVAALELGETIHLGDLQVPAGVEITALAHGGDPHQPVVSVHLPRAAVEEEAAEGEEAEEGAVAAAAPAAPAEPEGSED